MGCAFLTLRAAPASLDLADRVAVARGPDAERPTSDDWDVHLGELCQRVATVQRLPGVRFRQTLTGGKDSRLLLGALVASGAVAAVDDCFVEAEPGHPDAEVAKHLGAHYGLGVEVFLAEHNEQPLLDLVEQHNFQTEIAFHAYDIKGCALRPRRGGINGFHGEIFKSHLQPQFLLDERDDGFFDIIDRRKLTERLALARARPSKRPVEQMLGCVGMRAALQGIKVRPVRIAGL